MDELIKSINKHPNGTKITVEFKNKLKLFCSIDTIYETNNELEMDDENYEEFFACLVQVIEVINLPLGNTFSTTVGSLIEVTMKNAPKKITLEDGKILWETD